MTRYGVLLILDEVMSGMGRTGTLHACTQEEVAPDIMTIAKGLGRRLSADWAMLASRTICDTIQAGSGAFQHGHTYIGHATACAAALAVQQTVRDEHLLDAVQVRGKELAKALDRAVRQSLYIRRLFVAEDYSWGSNWFRIVRAKRRLILR